ncbi:hypothetical protein [Aquipseudomonas alcaligenes]|uniref:hypothetical protein n=1 Tax=Aquipseudomonas alcaligenes TaxID=43263 RepID=UPI0011B43714|nr:hypothetical protein [Pseudomonas alcaligenes]
MSALENLSVFAYSASLEAQDLHQAYDDEGLSNPIGVFTCPCCGQVADVEYGCGGPESPSENIGRFGPDGALDAARCFQCSGVSYWRTVDFDKHNNGGNNGGRDWKDFPRVLVYAPKATKTHATLSEPKGATV